MTIVTITARDAQHQFPQLMQRAAAGEERILIESDGTPRVAIISAEDLHLLERLIEEEEDRIDLEGAREAREESGSISLENVKSELGLA